jgi:purine-nucleoside phosphorylase
MNAAAIQKLKSLLGDFQPEWGLVLGSGLGFFAEEHITQPVFIPYADVPGFPQSTVEGHAGRFVCGKVAGKSVICMQGRFHYYEGYSLEQVVMPIRLMAALGVEKLMLTNAAGGICVDLLPGSLMLIKDHINLIGSNPLRGPNADEFGTRFPDMTEAYDRRLRRVALDIAARQGTSLREGVYLATSGPSFETPAEIRAFKHLGADAVGMSTVPECIVARHCGIKVAGISCITNSAAGLGQGTLSHEEVSATAAKVKDRFAALLTGIISA